MHVTLRLARHAWNLRSQRGFTIVERAMRRANLRRLIRVVHFSVQHDHIHLIVESGDRRSLSRGIKGFEVRLARWLNRMMDRKGRAVGDRYHARPLRSPREVRNALVYVLNNRVHHRPELVGTDYVDAYSSGPFFGGFTHVPINVRSACIGTGPPTLDASTWLLDIGWKRHGLLRPGALA